MKKPGFSDTIQDGYQIDNGHHLFSFKATSFFYKRCRKFYYVLQEKYKIHNVKKKQDKKNYSVS